MLLLIGILIALFVPAPWSVAVVIGAATLEFVETAFSVWVSRRGRPRVGVETLVGATGRVVADCLPAGTVRVGGEIWRARCDAGARSGERVRVRARHGLVLLVDAVGEGDDDGPSSAPAMSR
ncbi:MAG TPA: NfeD family protein [Candidatus Limnocylindrales bacterium]|nr:NfeD family protein [Candidatus Limnocylindrales bacterium]